MTPVEQWLTRYVLTAEALTAVADRQLDRARSSLSSGARGMHSAESSWQIDGPRVHYRHPVHGTGTRSVRRLVALALEARTDVGADRLQQAYRAYVDEAINRRMPYPRDWDAEPEQLAAAEAHFARYCAASRALTAATAAWWDAPVLEESVQLDLFEAVAS